MGNPRHNRFTLKDTFRDLRENFLLDLELKYFLKNLPLIFLISLLCTCMGQKYLYKYIPRVELLF